MEDKQIAKFIKKAEKKNKAKKIDNQRVLLLQKDELTDYTHLLNNLSDILYTKVVVNLNEVDNKTLLKEIIQAKYIFIDDYDPRLIGFNFDEQETIFLTHSCGYLSVPFDEVDEYHQQFFSKMKHIVVGSDLMKDYYQQLYDIEDDRFMLLGYFLNDKFYSKKWEQNAQKIADGYLDLLFRINIYYLPKDFDRDISQELKSLMDNFDENYNILYYSHNTYDLDPMRVQKVYEEDVRYMFNNVNVVITDGNELIFEMYNNNKHIKVCSNLEELQQVVNAIKNNDFETNNEMLTQDWYEYDTGVCCRSIVTSLMRLV